MRKQFALGTCLLSAAILSTNAVAFDMGKPVTTQILITKSGTNTTEKKDIVVMKRDLTPKQRKTLFSFQPKRSGIRSNPSLPASVMLGMNDVPVLDQGRHGSCVTFATTAAINAVLGKGDYVSQLCSLELGSYLENKGYMPSGWNGSFGPWVLDQYMRFGVVSKQNQLTKSCADVKEYPVNDGFSEGNPMSVDSFRDMSENLSAKMYWYPLMNEFQRFETRYSDTDQTFKVLNQVKEALSKGNRVTFGTFLVINPYCSAGACASFKAKQDTWALTKDIELPPFETGGHEMVIIGYDDNAFATDNEGKKHQGLLTLRNSWGVEAGDHGNYYMTYDYFMKFAGEVQVIAEIRE